MTTYFLKYRRTGAEVGSFTGSLKEALDTRVPMTLVAEPLGEGWEIYLQDDGSLVPWPE